MSIVNCISCFSEIGDKDIIAINKKLFGENNTKFYCINCLAEYFSCSQQDIYDKIEEFKDEGCKLFT